MRVVMFVYNDMTMDVRVQREAATLAAAGHEVTVMARPRDVHSRIGETVMGDGYEIIRVPVPAGWRRPWSAAQLPGRAVSGVARRLRGRPRGQSTGPRPIDFMVKWRFAVLGWNTRAAAAAPVADVYHGHDLSGLPAAVLAAERNGGRVVYDSHELFVESGNTALQPACVRTRLADLERRLARRAIALVTVNETLSRTLGERLGIKRRVVVYNAPASREAPSGDAVAARASSPLRAATGVGDGPIALYHGGFQANRGLLMLIRAFREPVVARVHLAFLGSGPMAGELRRLAADPALGGRVHVLDAVPPPELLAWVAGADVECMVNAPASWNERLSTPNKLFESLAAGVPVVSSDFPERRRIVMDGPTGALGLVCDPVDPVAIAAAIAALAGAPAGERTALRARCAEAARSLWNWEREGGKLRDLYAALSVEGAR